MKVIGEGNGVDNCSFKVGPKRIFFNLSLLKRLVGKTLRIDVLESSIAAGAAELDGNTVYLNFSGLVGKKIDNLAIKKEIVHTLAHEAYHTLQKEDDVSFFWNLVSLSWQHVFVFSALVILMSIGGLVSVFLFHSWIPSVVFNAIGFIVFFSLVLYYFCPIEAEAKSFADKALRDEDWLNIVKVKDVP